MNYRRPTYEAFLKMLTANGGGANPNRFCFVLGAGASKSSRIRTGQELVQIWEKALSEQDGPDHERWKREKGITPENRSSFYGDYYERMFPDPWQGYTFLEKEMKDKKPGAGYIMLASILCKKNSDHNIVITTNFDHLTEDAIHLYQKELPLVISHEVLVPSFRIGLRRPVIMKLHRDLLMGPKNTGEETRVLADNWKYCLDKVFSDYHPIFIGYAGNDESLMDYLIENAEKFRTGAWRTPYWTLYEKTPLSEKAERFMDRAGGFVVQDCDFDTMMIEICKEMQIVALPPRETALKQVAEEYDKLQETISRVLQRYAERNSLTEEQGGEADRPQRTGDSEKTDARAREERLNEAIAQVTGDTDPASPSARHRQAVVAFNRKDYPEAERLLRQLVKEEPENAFYHYQLGNVLGWMERYPDAEPEHRRAVELEPENALYHNNLGATLQWMKRNKEAEEEHRLAVELDSNTAMYRYEHGKTLHRLERYEEAEAEKRRATELEPENAVYHHSLGVTLHEMKRYEEAEAEKRRAVELEPENAEYHYSSGVTLHAMKRYEEAEAELRRAVELELENARYHDSLGVTLHEMKRYEEAEAEKRRAVELEPENAKYHRSLGVTLREMKRYDEALAEINRAIELDPESPKPYKSLTLLYKAMGKPEEAERAEAKAKELEAKQAEAKGTGETETT